MLQWREVPKIVSGTFFHFLLILVCVWMVLVQPASRWCCCVADIAECTRSHLHRRSLKHHVCVFHLHDLLVPNRNLCQILRCSLLIRTPVWEMIVAQSVNSTAVRQQRCLFPRPDLTLTVRTSAVLLKAGSAQCGRMCYEAHFVKYLKMKSDVLEWVMHELL